MRLRILLVTLGLATALTGCGLDDAEPGSERGSEGHDKVADYIEEQLGERTTDGFIVFPPYLPGPLDAFVDLVVPELQRRGLFRTEYGPERTFREFFGLSKPSNQFVRSAS